MREIRIEEANNGYILSIKPSNNSIKSEQYAFESAESLAKFVLLWAKDKEK